MVSVRKEKMQLKSAILSVLERDGQAKEEVFISSIKLDTGFSEKFIRGILQDMNNVDLIDIQDGMIHLTQKDKDGVNAQ